MTAFSIVLTMAISENTRLHYLNALGITVWQSRINETCSTIAEISLPPSSANEDALPPDSWEALRNQVIQCEQCILCTTRKQTVFGEGNSNAKWMFIGEAPGKEEDFHGIPFIGEEGNLLTEMLRAMQLTREEVFITNILKCRLPDNRNPHVDEIHACRDYLHRQIALINPKMIITFGQVSAQTLLATTDTIENLRGKIHQFQHKPLITVYHPNYMLRSPIEKSKTWHDLQFALEAFKRHQ